MNDQVKKHSSRWVAVLILLLLAAALTAGWFWLRKEGLLILFTSPEALQATISRYGLRAPLIFFLLQMAQVIISPIPGNITTLAGGALFGFGKAFLISAAAIITGSMIAFLLAKLFGRPLVKRLVGEAVVQKYLDTLSSRQRITLFIMFLLPFFPDDALCLIAGLTGISWLNFLLLMILTRPWGLLFSALVGSGKLNFPWPVWGIIIALSAFLIFASYRWGPQIEEVLLQRINKNRIKE